MNNGYLGRWSVANISLTDEMRWCHLNVSSDFYWLWIPNCRVRTVCPNYVIHHHTMTITDKVTFMLFFVGFFFGFFICHAARHKLYPSRTQVGITVTEQLRELVYGIEGLDQAFLDMTSSFRRNIFQILSFVMITTFAIFICSFQIVFIQKSELRKIEPWT